MSSVWKHFSRARKYHTVLYETRDTIKNERKTIFHFKNTQTAGYQQNDRKLIHQISETEPEAKRLLGCLVQNKPFTKAALQKWTRKPKRNIDLGNKKISQLTSGNSEFELCRESNRKWKCQTRNPLNVEEFVPSWLRSKTSCNRSLYITKKSDFAVEILQRRGRQHGATAIHCDQYHLL